MPASTRPLVPLRTHTLAWTKLVVFALLLVSSGCRSVGYPAATASGYAGDYGGGYGGGEYGEAEEQAKSAEYDYRNDMATGGAPPPPAPVPTTTDSLEEAPQDSSVTQPSPEPSPDQPAPESAARKVVYTATMQVSVYELPEAMAFAEALPERYAGWVQSRYDTTITIRVPAGRLREAMDELAALGVLLGKSLQASDVTAEYTDLESRILVLGQMEEQLLLLLDQAKTVEESLKIRQELERVRIELELARARMRSLAELISFSTLTINFVQRGPLTPEIGGNDPFPWVDELGVEATEFR